MDHFKHSWPGLGVECPFCSHSKCRACVEVSVNVLACCVCRTRAIRRLAYLKEIYSSAELSPKVEPQLNPPADVTVSSGSGATRR